jgi:hypothetical protein
MLVVAGCWVMAIQQGTWCPPCLVLGEGGQVTYRQYGGQRRG